MTNVLFCPRCRCEYFGRVVECADCGVALVPEHALAASQPGELQSKVRHRHRRLSRSSSVQLEPEGPSQRSLVRSLSRKKSRFTAMAHMTVEVTTNCR